MLFAAVAVGMPCHAQVVVQNLRAPATVTPKEVLDGYGCPVNKPIPHYANRPGAIQDSYREFYAGTQLHYRGHLSNSDLVGDKHMNFTKFEGLNTPNVVFWGSDMERKGFVQVSAYDKTTTLTGTDPNGIVMIDPRTKDFTTLKQHTVLNDGHDYVFLTMVKFGVFAHFWLDYIGLIAHLRERFEIGKSNYRLILADLRGQNRQLLTQLDPEFESQVTWIDCFQPFDCNHAINVRGETASLSVFQPHTIARHMNLLESARSWIDEVFPPKPVIQKTVVYYTRNSANAHHGRAMNPEHEAILIHKISNKLLGRPEKLVIFDGEGHTLEQQVDLFRSASVVIGSHGGGMANLLFMNPGHHCYDSTTKPKVLEFLTNPDTPLVQSGVYFKTYYNLYSTIPWVEYHHVLYVPPSGLNTVDGYFVDLDEFQAALDDIFAST